MHRTLRIPRSKIACMRRIGRPGGEGSCGTAAASRSGPCNLLIISLIAVLFTTVACDALFPDEGEIDRDTFIETQVELELAATETTTEELTQVQRDSILAEQGVTEEELEAFIAVHGADELYMTELWAEVDRRVLEARGLEPPNTSGRTSSRAKP